MGVIFVGPKSDGEVYREHERNYNDKEMIFQDLAS